MKTYTMELTEDELDTVLTGLDDTEYWRAEMLYRNNGVASEPYHDSEPEEAQRCREACALHEKLTVKKLEQDNADGPQRTTEEPT